MYYNPETKDTASREDLMVQFNASIPESAEEVNGWHLIDESILYPSLENGQTAIAEGIELHNGKYARTYSVKDAPALSTPIADDSLEAKYARLEQAFLDLAQMVSNLEEYRMLAEREKEEAANPEQNAE